MSQDSKQRADGPITTSITPLGNGHYGTRVLCAGRVVFQDNSPTTKREASIALKQQLRMLDKCGAFLTDGHSSEMASRSRDRFYCGKKRP